LPRLAIAKDFLDGYSRLGRSVQNAVKDAIGKFWRGVVLAPDSGDTYSLIRVLPHGKAIDYAASTSSPSTRCSALSRSGPRPLRWSRD
jgi:hypothetical protein